MTEYRLRIRGQEAEVKVRREGDRLFVTRGGHTTELGLLHQDEEALTLEVQSPDGLNHTVRLVGHRNGDERQLWVNGYYFAYERVRRRPAAASAELGSLSASIPAVVTEILVKIGDRVTLGQRLILLESMKMVIPIQAPSDAVVKAVHCVAGESVQAGVPLLELEEATEEAPGTS